MRTQRYGGRAARLAARVHPVWAAIAVTLLAAALLIMARLVDGFNRDLLINLGASLAFVPPTYLIFGPIFERLRQTAAAIEVHLALDTNRLISYIENSQSKVQILETWTGLLEDAHRRSFLTALQIALDRRVDVQILLLDPASSPAEQRAEELNDERVPILIAENLRHLHQFRGILTEAGLQSLEIRIYDASPSVQLYRWDDKAFVSFFPIGKRAYDTRQIETYLANPLGEFAESRFDELWSATTTCSLDDYMALPLCIYSTAAAPTEHLLAFVQHGEEFFVDGSPFWEDPGDAVGPLTARLGTVDSPVRRDGVATSYQLARLELSGNGHAGVISQLFAVKYGDHENHPLIIHLQKATRP